MAKVDFSSLEEESAGYSNSSAAGNSDFGFFTLKNDNEEAIVRFMIDSTDDFDIYAVHTVNLGDRYRKVNCLRDPREPLDKCPLCNNGSKIDLRFFIKLIQYVKVVDPASGASTIVPKAMLWERSTAYAKMLKSYLDNYGPLSDVICKIIRHGKSGDMQTKYEIIPNLSKAVYKDEIYPKDPTLFDNVTTLGTVVMDKSFEDMSQFVMTGSFPNINKTSDGDNNVQSERVATNNSYNSAPTTASTSPVSSHTESINSANSNNAVDNTYSRTNTVSSNASFDPNRITPRSTNFGGSTSNQTPVSGFERPRRY